MSKKFTASALERKVIKALLLKIRRQILTEEYIGMSPQEIILRLKKIVRADNMERMGKKNVLRLISGKEPLIIDACDGTLTFCDEKENFHLINQDIHSVEERKDGPTEKTGVRVYTTKQQGVVTYADIFAPSSDGDALKRRCLSEHQVILFCKKHYSFLHTASENHATLFLRKKGKLFFVIRVFGNSMDDLSIREDSFRLGEKLLTAGVQVVLPDLEA